MNLRQLSAIGVAVVCLLSGCVMVAPNLDSAFGDSVRLAQARQTLNPDASRNTGVVRRIEGVASKNALDRYNDSFKNPPPTNIFTINVGGGAGGGGQ
jgi:hypothetical protein